MFRIKKMFHNEPPPSYDSVVYKNYTQNIIFNPRSSNYRMQDHNIHRQEINYRQLERNYETNQLEVNVFANQENGFHSGANYTNQNRFNTTSEITTEHQQLTLKQNCLRTYIIVHFLRCH